MNTFATKPYMPFRRMTLAMISVFAFTTPCFAGSQYVDPQGRFKVYVPSGWQVVTRSKTSHLQLNSVIMQPEDKSRDVKCLITVSKTPESVGWTQAEVNEFRVGNQTKEIIRGGLTDAGALDVSVSNAGNRDASHGRKVMFGIVSLKLPGVSGKRKLKTEWQYLPGIKHSLLCDAELTQYGTAEADFNAIINSYEPMR